MSPKFAWADGYAGLVTLQFDVYLKATSNTHGNFHIIMMRFIQILVIAACSWLHFDDYWKNINEILFVFIIFKELLNLPKITETYENVSPCNYF